jgi:hypothetical protein
MVQFLTNLRYIRLRHKTARTWTVSLVSYSGQKNPVNSESKISAASENDSLFWIVHRIVKYMWVKPPRGAIVTIGHEAMSIHCDKLVIQHEMPNLLHEFATAISVATIVTDAFRKN